MLRRRLVGLPPTDEQFPLGKSDPAGQYNPPMVKQAGAGPPAVGNERKRHLLP